MLLAQTRKPTWKTGYAPNASDSSHPYLWKRLVGAWGPTLGPTGTTMRDVGASKNHGTFGSNTHWRKTGIGYAVRTSRESDDAVGPSTVIDVSRPIVGSALKGFSVAFWWIIPTGLTRDDFFGSWSGTLQLLCRFSGGDLEFFLRNSADTTSGTLALAEGNVVDNALHHTVFTADNVNMRIYNDGVLVVGPTAFAGPYFPSDASDWRFGGVAGRGESVVDFINTTVYQRALGSSEIKQLHTLGRGGIFTLRRRRPFVTTQISAAITGTATATIDEADVVAGSKTTIITLTGDNWVAAGAPFDAQRQAIIDGLDSAQSEGTGWNAEVRDKEVVGAVVRTSDTVVTITLTAAATYDITAQETITVTVPAAALVTSAVDVVGSPTFTVDAVAAALPKGSLALLGVGV